MKVLYITNQICGSGGLERVLSIKTKYLTEKFDYEVHIATLNQFNEPLFFEFSNKIIHHNVEVWGNYFQYLRRYSIGFKKIVSAINPDIILVCDDGFKGFLLPIILKKPCPMIYERHVSKNILINENDNFLKILKTKITFLTMNFFGQFYSKFIVLTNDSIAEWNLKNIEVIENPLTFYPKESANLKNKIVIAVGKQSYQKGYDRLLKSWQIVHKKNPTWTLKIYGNIDKDKGLIDLSKKLNLQNSVQFFNANKNIQEKYLEASIFVLSSRYEGFGMVIIEAMACGLPIVSFDCPCGPRDIIQNEIDGFLIENNNVEEFANKINELIENENLRAQFGSNAKQNVKRYLPEIVIKKWDNLFKKIRQ